ncbi:UNKNOWN [Stylonychia lemnae]|uniref:Uncharacterized protein n=1 Tax=Stylonychia lemnae TaxID=5949 RepID=A0A078B3N4_STYLE|nr:UNKNOWN [Stylonychia lemnae]|eukprot:CDW89064.1 UNKNOWN [Stylonychia lemnae]
MIIGIARGKSFNTTFMCLIIFTLCILLSSNPTAQVQAQMYSICHPNQELGAGRPMDLVFNKPSIKNALSDTWIFLKKPSWKNLKAAMLNNYWYFISPFIAGIMGPNSLCEFENNELYYRLSQKDQDDVYVQLMTIEKNNWDFFYGVNGADNAGY